MVTLFARRSAMLAALTFTSLALATTSAAAVPALDTAFAGGVITPKVFPDGNHFQYASGAVVQADGKVVVAMAISREYGRPATRPVLRYNSDGSLDASYGSNGVAWISVEGYRYAGLHGVVLGPNGQSTVWGLAQRRSGGRPDPFLARLDASGKIDRSFGKNGITVLPSTRRRVGEIQRVHLWPGGKLLVSVLISQGDSSQLKFTRLTSGGHVDRAFARSGDREIDVDPTNLFPFVADVELIGNQAYVLMSVDSDQPGTPCRLRRVDLRSRGGLVGSFGKRGQALIFPPSRDASISCSGLAAMSGGGIAVAGSVALENLGGLVEGFIYRYRAKGTRDTSFANSKYVTGRDYDTIDEITPLGGGEFLTAGSRLAPNSDGGGNLGGVAMTMNGAGKVTELLGGATFPQTGRSYVTSLDNSDGGSVILYTHDPQVGPSDSRIVKLTN